MSETNLPAEQTLYPSKMKWGGIALICALVIAFSFAFPMALWLKGLIIVLMAIGVVAGLAQGFMGSSWLKLTEAGFEYSRFGSVTSHNWMDVSEFSLLRINMIFVPIASQVVFAFREPGTPADDLRKTGLPDSYGLGNKKLIKLMNAYREKAIGVAPPAQ